MAQVGFSKLTNEWVALSDIITVDSNTVYRIQNRGIDKVIALESSSEPSDDVREGNEILPGKTGEYKKGTQDLYLKAASFSPCEINITSEG